VLRPGPNVLPPLEHVRLDGRALALERMRDALGPGQHAQDVLRREPGHLLVGPAAPDQLGHEVGVLAGILKALGGLADAVEVRADADVAAAGELADVIDVVGQERDVGAQAVLAALANELREPSNGESASFNYCMVQEQVQQLTSGE